MMHIILIEEKLKQGVFCWVLIEDHERKRFSDYFSEKTITIQRPLEFSTFLNVVPNGEAVNVKWVPLITPRIFQRGCSVFSVPWSQCRSFFSNFYRDKEQFFVFVV